MIAGLPKARAPVNLDEAICAACERLGGITSEVFHSMLSPEDVADIEAGDIHPKTLHAYALSFAEGIRSGRPVPAVGAMIAGKPLTPVGWPLADYPVLARSACPTGPARWTACRGAWPWSPCARTGACCGREDLSAHTTSPGVPRSLRENAFDRSLDHIAMTRPGRAPARQRHVLPIAYQLCDALELCAHRAVRMPVIN